MLNVDAKAITEPSPKQAWLESAVTATLTKPNEIGTYFFGHLFAVHVRLLEPLVNVWFLFIVI